MTTRPTIASVVLNDFLNDSRVLKEARSLLGHGYDVTVVAMHADSLPERETIEGFKLHRIKLRSRQWPKNLLVQLLKYLEFLCRAIKHYRHSDVLHCHDLSALPVGVVSKLFFNRRAKVVYDAHEHETHIAQLTPITRRLSQFFERLLIKHADEVITVSGSIADDYARLYGIDTPKLVLNAPLLAEVKRSNKLREELGIRADQRIYLYQGALSPGRGIDLILETAASQPTDDNAFVFMGFGRLEKKIREAASRRGNVFMQPAVPPNEILDYSSSADVGMCLIEDESLSYRYALPNKLFEYVMAGIPLICSDLPEMRKFVEQQNVGVVLPAITPAGVQSAMQAISDLDQETLAGALDSTKKIFNWRSQEDVLLSIYDALAPHEHQAGKR